MLTFARALKCSLEVMRSNTFDFQVLHLIRSDLLSVLDKILLNVCFKFFYLIILQIVHIEKHKTSLINIWHVLYCFQMSWSHYLIVETL